LIVVDCSALVSFLLVPAGDAELVRILAEVDELAAPDIVHVECISALRRLELSGQLLSSSSERAFGYFCDLRIERFPSQDLRQPIWRLRRNFSAYDAAYVALAATLNVPLLTRDEKLRRAVAAHTAITLL
jgi:predicted nucleic acid-binding protein